MCTGLVGTSITENLCVGVLSVDALHEVAG